MNVWIIEDEDTAARRLEKLIREIDPQIQVGARMDSILGTLEYLEKNKLPDLILLDIHLADGASFEIFNHANIEKPIIFTTAYDQYAIQAFKVNALDYLLKPIKKAELEKALEKYRNWNKKPSISYEEIARLMQPEKTSRRFLIRIGQRIQLVDIKDAAYFYTDQKITFVVNWDGKRYPLDHSLEALEEMLDCQEFFRINRQFIVHINAINEMYAYSKSRVKLDLKPVCDIHTVVSTERSPHFKRWLEGGIE
ncbi:MAG: DNA-binding response regulator [Saprospiraceae bacterium]|nr:MAG: DNA-binding response regulator [Saprospiraceae bacterium]